MPPSAVTYQSEAPDPARPLHQIELGVDADNGSIKLSMSAGNGSLMRLAPVAIRFWNHRAKLRDIAARQSKTTHAAPEAVDACIAFAEVLADAIEGRSKLLVLRARPEAYASAIGSIMRGQWRDKARAEIRSTGYVAHSLEAQRSPDCWQALFTVRQAFLRIGSVESPGAIRSKQ